MLDRLARPAMPTRDVFLATKLVVRDSCGASKVPEAPTAEEPMAHKNDAHRHLGSISFERDHA